MALRGNLKEISLPDIFQLVAFSGKTGVLRIHRADGAQGSVWFRNGGVFFAQSNWHTDLLGERLVRAQRITPMALDRALELRSEEGQDGKRLGEILVEQGYITDSVLEAFVQEQMQDTIFDLMRWDEGDFEFEAMPEAPEEDIGLAVSIENVIMEGSRRLEEWNRVKKKIPSTDVVFKMATAPGEGTFEISLKPIEWNLLLLIDGSRSVAELAEETNRTDFEVARIVYGLFSAGLLEFATEDEIACTRAERSDREAKYVAFEAELGSRGAAEQAAGPRPIAEPTPEAAFGPAGDVSVPAPEELPEITLAELFGSSAPADVPQFLDAATTAPAADFSALEAAMDALLTVPPVAMPPAIPTVPYSPGEEPAFIAASQESEATGQVMAVPSVEGLLVDMAGLVPEPVVKDEPESWPVPESVSESGLPTPPLKPGSYVVVPPPMPPASDVPMAPIPADWVPPSIDFDDDVHVPESAVPASTFGLTMMPVTAPVPTRDAVPGLIPDVTAVPEPPAVRIPEVVLPAASLPPAEEPFLAAPVEPVAEMAPTGPQVDSAIPGLEDFEHDLMSLGLGELPSALREQHIGDTLEPEPVMEPMSMGPVEEPAAPALAPSHTPEPLPDAPDAPVVHDGPADFSALLQSLDISADDAALAPAAESVLQPTFLLDSEPVIQIDSTERGSGVISTDSYMDDLSLEDGLAFGGELTDELSALTGADRPSRPAVNVHKIPVEGEAMLHRDARVDRDTLLKIIRGIENL